MSTASCAEELDFTLSFEEDRRQTAGPDPDGPPSFTPTITSQPVSLELQSHPPCLPVTDNYQLVGCQSQGTQYGAQENPRVFHCPSIQITTFNPGNQTDLGSQDGLAVAGAEGGYLEASWGRDHLYLPLDPCYRDPSFSPSPCSSLSSRSWVSDVSSCESFSHISDDAEVEQNEAGAYGSPLPSPGCGGGSFGVELWQLKYQSPQIFNPSLSPYQSPRQSPCHSPRTSVTEENWLTHRPASRSSSRPTSPCGKRRHSGAEPHALSPSPHHSPSPTPSASRRGSATDETCLGSPAGVPGMLLAYGYQEPDVPSKTRRTSTAQLGPLSGQGDCVLEELNAVNSPGEERFDQEGLAELFLTVPSQFSRAKPSLPAPPLFRTSLPSLDLPLPSRFEEWELRLEVQPKSFHRAQYETEGSRGAIKASTGGHPVVKLVGNCEQPVDLLMFIGTADDHIPRPHPFYHVQRVTGKKVVTPCQERILGGTKVLVIPLLPENDMSASIDCVGILKLRNADIELKKAEGGVGRKNTRVRVVFRVSIPLQDGSTLWLQTASVPVECSQRSAQDVPQVSSFSPTSYYVDGGEEMIITGSNFSTLSRVVFTKKGHDGSSLWEVDERLVAEKSSEFRAVVQIPPYYNEMIGFPVQVQFYVINGKTRKSLAQNFTYVPKPAQPLHAAAMVKQEHDPHNLPGLCSASCQALPQDHGLSPDPADLPVLSDPSQNIPRLHHPPPSSEMSSYILLHPQIFSTPPQTSLVHSPTSSFRVSGLQKDWCPSLGSVGAFATPTEPQRDPMLSGCGDALSMDRDLLSRCGDTPSIDRDQLSGCGDAPSIDRDLNLEITLDDVDEVIYRDSAGKSGGPQLDQYDQYEQYQRCEWEQKPSVEALRFRGGPDS